MSKLPIQFIQSIQSVTGFNEKEFIDIHQTGKPITSIRLNTEKKVEGLFEENEKILWCNEGRYLAERPLFTIDPLFHAGAYYVQEASSMFLKHILNQLKFSTDKLRILDLCAAPGGKTTLLANYFKNSLIVANEIIKTRVGVLAENITKWGSSNVLVSNNDPRNFKTLKGFFDIILVDAPCSGSGLFRKDAKAINEWSEENVNLCSLRQQRILADIIPCLKQNGILIYSTCSYSEKENEEICDYISSQFKLENVAIPVNEKWNIVTTNSKKNNEGYRFFPDKVKGEGFFISAFKQSNSVEETSIYSTPIKNISKAEEEIIKPFIKNFDELVIDQHQNNFIVFNKSFFNERSFILSFLRIIKSGVLLGAIKGKDFIPHHELAMSPLLNDKLYCIELNIEDALQFLRKNNFEINDKKPGWILMKYKNIALGWIKNMPNRFNNYYPIDWRILKY